MWSIAFTAMPASAARARPAASGRFESTSTISAGKSGARAASISETMFEPRPEIRIATRVLSAVLTA